MIILLGLLLAQPVWKSPAPQRGVGTVYHKSDCDYPAVRSYAFGGNAKGNECRTWGLSRADLNTIWSDGSKNWICQIQVGSSSANSTCK